MKFSIKEPIPEIFQCWTYLNEAVTAHLAGDNPKAEKLFKTANMRKVYEWLNPAWSMPYLNVVVKNPPGDSLEIPKNLRDPDRRIKASIRSAVLMRDGYRCRYCGIPVVDAKIRKLAYQLYPNAVSWGSSPHVQHAGFSCLWLQFDHVEPHSHGGPSSEDNIVISCALCNFGKDKFTLRQLSIEDPRLRPPIPTEWDGLERLKGGLETRSAFEVSDEKSNKIATDKTIVETARSRMHQAFFLQGAWVKSGYLYTPEIDGKERWFKLGEHIAAEPVTRGGVAGYRLLCDPEVLRRRKIRADLIIDQV